MLNEIIETESTETRYFTAAEIAENDYIVVGDNIVCDQWGEELGLTHDTTVKRFVIDSADAAKWVLRKLGKAEATQAHAEAIVKNANDMLKRAKARVEGLTQRFEAELGEFAKKELEGEKVKTWWSEYGSIGLRATKGGLRVKNETDALAVAQSEGFTNAIKTTEKFQISGLTDAQRELIEAKLRKLPSNDNSIGGSAFEIVAPGTSISIKTGVA